jgi:hypothetical protein
MTKKDKKLNILFYFNNIFLFFLQRDFARDLLRPALQSSPAARHLKIMAFDDQRGGVWPAAQVIYNDSSSYSSSSSSAESESAIDGLATHWYDHAGFKGLSRAHELRPEKFLLATEASCSLILLLLFGNSM